MTSIFSAGQSISSIGKSMTAIARVEEHLATFMKKVIYFEKFFQRMGANLPTCVMDTADLLFQRCYEYRDEIRDELESSVAYVADAGRWVVGMGDWNSKMEKRLAQISELVMLANTLLTEYAVTGEVGAEGCRDELDAYLQILSATVTLKNAPVNGKGGTSTTDGRPPVVRAQPTTAAEFSSEMSALGTEITGAFTEMFGNKDLSRSASSGTIGQTSNPQSAIRASNDNDAMNPFTASYRRPVDPYARAASSAGASVSSSVQSLPDPSAGGAMGPDYPLSDGDTPEGPLSPVSLGEYECLEMDSIPKYAAFKSSAQLAARRQYTPGSMANSMTSDGGRSAYSESSAEYHELFPLPPSSAQAVSKSLSSLDTAPNHKKPAAKPIMDMNYSYDFQCEVAHNPFLSPNTPGPMAAPPGVASIGHVSLSPDQQLNPSVGNRSEITALPTAPAATATTSMSATPDHPHTLGPVAIPSEPVLGTVAPTPTLHPAIDYTHAQAHAAPISGHVAAVSNWSANANSTRVQTISEEDETEVLVAALKASATEQEHHHDSDHDFDLFGVGKP
ncbi:uncharacterized protein IUM83_05131 [Phytophthora cinnamomi]|uniref:uncharacterized protein n=1 Tax=Phytophthora cinnamomi TaxID=4785 RepID=UPI0035598AD2|nr:hypothetical protein IUM83_05131 [Phytophthora cinnamomi]